MTIGLWGHQPVWSAGSRETTGGVASETMGWDGEGRLQKICLISLEWMHRGRRGLSIWSATKLRARLGNWNQRMGKRLKIASKLGQWVSRKRQHGFWWVIKKNVPCFSRHSDPSTVFSCLVMLPTLLHFLLSRHTQKFSVATLLSLRLCCYHHSFL